MSKIYNQTAKVLILITSCIFFAKFSYADLTYFDFMGLNSNVDLVFSKIKKAGTAPDSSIVRSIWVQGYMDVSETKKVADTGHTLKSDKRGVILGLNILTSKNVIAGAYGDYGIDNYFFVDGKKVSSHGNDRKGEIGIYYGSFGELMNKKYLGAYVYHIFGFYDYDDLFYKEKEFWVNGGKLGLDIEFLIPISQSIDFKPFIQGQGIVLYNDRKVFNNDIMLAGVTYRAKPIAGVRFADDKSAFNWNLDIHIGALFSGRLGVDKIEKSTAASNPVDLDSTQKMIYGGALEIEYVLGAISFFAGGGADLGENFTDYYGKGGLRILFGLPKKEDKKEDNEEGDKSKDGGNDNKAVSNADPNQTVDEIGSKTPEKLSNSLIAQERAISQIGAKNPIDSSAASSGGAAYAVSSDYDYPVENPQSASPNQRNDIPVVELNDDAILLKKAQEDRARHANLIKSFILSVAVFQPGGYELTREAKQEIKALSDNIKKYEYSIITIEGHTDSSGNVEQNQKISTLRARSVFGELFINGIPLEKMQYVGLGSTMPMASNNTAAGRARNRRVEIFVE
ncbi:MAG: OmpA family protein [Elusimicrobiota bacterium]|jgi:outer membrane protein OmpA-like peptidoglycan-associated protein|nr:OmpA family protein [Elusimicrobiota bacterium]